ncbi:fructokinase [Undibacterium sp. LX40W]|uniref:Fructokinase n=1 Tax=Undibacterium nitidum TaxID=2762298 RepID=A0A923HMZ3_9BURK|nr:MULTISPECIES: PfkB family carbohydrate kinase [Undibacterium]MBC3882565.1 fructokinase [Undibacterium nitidum]MBC3892846.1 fructokinase [Undibacterium sp. LX40W]
MRNESTTLSTPNFNLIVFGEALIDDFPEESVIGGAPFNVARSLAQLGAQPLMLTRIGDDPHGSLIQAEFARTGLSTLGMQVDQQHPSGRVAVHMEHGADASQHRFEILPMQAYDFIDAKQVLHLVQQRFPEDAPDLIYFGSMIQRSAASREALFALLEADCCEGATKFLDLNLRDGQASVETIQASLNYADIVKLNEDELRFVAKHALDEPYGAEISLGNESLRAACLALMQQYMMQAVIVTLGEQGYFYFDADHQIVTSLGRTMPSMPEGWVLRDTVGAGDAFSASFIRGWQQNQDLQTVLERANQFARAVCGVRGAVAPDLNFYTPWRV